MSRSIKSNIAAGILLGMTLALPLYAAYGQGRVPDVCSPYQDAVTGGSSDTSISAPPVPDSLLTNWTVALPCLVVAIEKLKPDIKGSALSPIVRGRFLRATGAVRTIMANNSPDKELQKVIEEFRNADSPDVVSVLAFGARSDDYNSRLNAMLILSNIVDNTTVCAPIDHLYDEVLRQDTEAAVKGRANLLAVVSVVAPWAYKENYEAIDEVRKFWLEKVPHDPKYKQTLEILENIRLRLESQTSSESSRFSAIPERLQECKRKYVRQWAPPENFKY
jgi:hypothetical protein